MELGRTVPERQLESTQPSRDHKCHGHIEDTRTRTVIADIQTVSRQVNDGGRSDIAQCSFITDTCDATLSDLVPYDPSFHIPRSHGVRGTGHRSGSQDTSCGNTCDIALVTQSCTDTYHSFRPDDCYRKHNQLNIVERLYDHSRLSQVSNTEFHSIDATNIAIFIPKISKRQPHHAPTTARC